MTLANKQSRIIVVLGMHRSGTSVITRALQVLGVDLGHRLLPPMLDNQKGFWEDAEITAANVEMLNAIGSDWYHLCPIQARDIDQLRKQGYFLRAVELLRQKVTRTSIFAFKDPRVAKLLPFWKEVFIYCQFDVCYVIAVRHPLSVVNSLARRNGFEVEHGYLLWLRHIINSLIGSVGNKRVFVDYDRLMQFPDHELTRIAKKFDLGIDSTKLQIYKTEFLDQELRHTVYDLDCFNLDEACPPIVREVAFALHDVATDRVRTDDIEFQNKLERWISVLEGWKLPLILIDKLFTQMAGSYAKVVAERDAVVAERDAVAAERDAVAAERDAAVACAIQMKNSTSWRLTQPLRFACRVARGRLSNEDRQRLTQTLQYHYHRLSIPNSVKRLVSFAYHKLFG